MNTGTMQFSSRALGRHVTYSVVLPEQGAGPFPVLLQLHGRGDDHTGWIKLSNLVRYARQYQMIIVIPDGGLSVWTNMSDTERYEDYLMEDLWAHVGATFHVRPGPWAIGGLSMGGYGAMRLGLKYPDRFASVWAHSGWYPNQEQLLRSGRSAINAADADVFMHAERVARAGVQPEITFDCGTEDGLLDHSRSLHTHMERIGLPHRYLEHPGGHTWEYWDLHVREALKQHHRVLNP